MKLFHSKNVSKALAIGAVAVFCANVPAVSAYAGSWVQDENKTWYYQDENGIAMTGWVEDTDTGLWYLLDPSTGAWVERPALNETSVVYLLKNAIKKAGYYQNEESPVEIVVTEKQKNKICAYVRMITGPNSYTNLNYYEIDTRTGHAAGTYKTDVDLY